MQSVRERCLCATRDRFIEQFLRRANSNAEAKPSKREQARLRAALSAHMGACTAPLARPGRARGRSGRALGAPWAALGAPWAVLGEPWAVLGAPWAAQGAPCAENTALCGRTAVFAVFEEPRPAEHSEGFSNFY